MAICCNGSPVLRLAVMREASSWESTFMRMAAVIAGRSKDPSTQVGAIITTVAHRVIGAGYNGMPHGLTDSPRLWERDTKRHLVIHAEQNAIYNTTANLTGATIYTTHRPCNECCKAIVQTGIKHVIYRETYDDGHWRESEHMLRAAGVTITKYVEET